MHRCRVSLKQGSYFEPELSIALGLQLYSSVIALALFPASPSHHAFGLFGDDNRIHLEDTKLCTGGVPFNSSPSRTPKLSLKKDSSAVSQHHVYVFLNHLYIKFCVYSLCTHLLDRGLANCSLWATSGLQPVFVHGLRMVFTVFKTL